MYSPKLLLAKLLALVVAIQILNLSICVQDFKELPAKHSIGEFNEINSVVEYVAEIILEHDNAMPEGKHSSHKDLQAHKHIDFKKAPVSKPANMQNEIAAAINYSYPIKDSYSFLYYKEINPPPPKEQDNLS